MPSTAEESAAELDLYHFEIFFGCPTVWTCPIGGHITPSSASIYAFSRRAKLFIIYPAADDAHVLFVFHQCAPTASI